MIHRTGKRASHTTKKYSVTIQAVESDEKEDISKASESVDHAVSIFVLLLKIGINLRKIRQNQSSSYPPQNRLKSTLEKLWKEEQSLSQCV